MRRVLDGSRQFSSLDPQAPAALSLRTGRVHVPGWVWELGSRCGGESLQGAGGVS